MIQAWSTTGPMALAAALLLNQPAAAKAPSGKPARTAELVAAVQDLGAARGTLTTTTLDLRAATPAGALAVTPTLGRRSQSGASTTALGLGLGWRRDWSDRIATGTDLFVGEANGPFAELTLAQSLTARVARSTALTAALRWSRYSGGQDVWFVSGEARRYVRRGSLAYRFSWIRPTGRSGYASHLLAFTLNDARGRGRTQLWLSQGQAALAAADLPDGFRGQDRTLQLRRVQRVSRNLALSLSGGLASYDLPGGALQSRNLGLGLSLEF